MQVDRKSDNAEISRLYETHEQANIKKAFELIDKQEWSLKETIDYVFKNHIIENELLLGMRVKINLIDCKFFYIGPLHFYFTAKKISEEQFGTLTTSKLSLWLFLSVDDIYGGSIKKVTFKDIQIIKLSDINFEKKEEMRPFDKKIDEYINKILSGVDRTKTRDLYSYITSYYSDFIDKVKMLDKL